MWNRQKYFEFLCIKYVKCLRFWNWRTLSVVSVGHPHFKVIWLRSLLPLISKATCAQWAAPSTHVCMFHNNSHSAFLSIHFSIILPPPELLLWPYIIYYQLCNPYYLITDNVRNPLAQGILKFKFASSESSRAFWKIHKALRDNRAQGFTYPSKYT